MKNNGSSGDTSWGGVAEWYNDLIEESPDSFQAKVILPNLIRVLDPKKGMKVIDIACGQGYFSRAFYANGADVLGCDISWELTSLAKKYTAEGLSFYTAPADKMDFAKDSAYDAATIILALQNIENMPGALAEAARVLKPGGRLVIVLNHPSFRIPGSTSWQWDEAASKQYRRVDSYLSDSRTAIDMTPGEADPAKKKSTVSFHRPLQSYVKALNKSGLAITRLEEWISHRKSQKGPRAGEEDRTRKEIPMFLMIEARKI